MNPPSNTSTIYYVAPFSTVPILDNEITLEELNLTLRKAKDGKAPGIDRISYEFYKNAPVIFLEKLQLMLNEIFNTQIMPSSFKNSIIFPLFKKGNLDVMSNYRGISFMDCVSKIYTGVLLRRLEKWVERYEILNEYQAGFRKGYSTVDCIYSLTGIIKLHCLTPKRKVYACFVDFKSAFDTVDRNALFYKLFEMGLSWKFNSNLQAIYKNTKSCVWNGDQLSEFFETNTGVKQGCLLSPILFSLYLNDLNGALGGGVEVGGWRIKILMYADDIVMISDSVQSLQMMINQLDTYCNKWNLAVNTNKTKIMVFGQGGRRSHNEKWRYRGEELEIVNSYTYLGINLTPKLSFQSHLKNKLSSGKANINAVWSDIKYTKQVSLSNMYKVFQSVNRSFVCYGSQIWGYTEYEDVEKFQRFFIKKVLVLPQNTPNYMIYLECQLQKLVTYTTKLHFDYIRNTMELQPHRLPNHITYQCIRREAFWVNDWIQLADRFGHSIDFNDRTSLKQVTESVLLELQKSHRQEWETEARMSLLHDEYRNLDYSIGNKYTHENSSIHRIMTIFKARGGMLNINSRSFQSHSSGICSLCNTNQPETTFHFIATCPILREFRVRYFNKRELSREEFLNYLNGEDLDNLYNYLKFASKYRLFLVNEYNI